MRSFATVPTIILLLEFVIIVFAWFCRKKKAVQRLTLQTSHIVLFLNIIIESHWIMFFSEGSHSSKPNFFSWKFCTVSRSFKIATKFMLYPQGKLLFYLCLYLTKNRKKKSLPIHTSGNHPYWWRNIFIFIIFEGKKKKIGLEFQKRATSKINIPFTIYIYIKKKIWSKFGVVYS